MISVKFSRPWVANLDPHGDTRQMFSAGLVIEIDEDIAVAAIGEGAAAPRSPLSAEMAERVALHKRLLELIAEGHSTDEALVILDEEIAAAHEAAQEANKAAAPVSRSGRTRKAAR